MSDDETVIYKPRELSGLELYSGLIIVCCIVFVYFTSLICFTVYLQHLKKKEAAELRQIEEMEAEGEAGQKDKPFAKKKTIKRNASIESGKISDKNKASFQIDDLPVEGDHNQRTDRQQKKRSKENPNDSSMDNDSIYSYKQQPRVGAGQN